MSEWQLQFSNNVGPVGDVQGFWFQWPVNVDGVHYLVKPTGSLAGKSTILMTGSMSGGPFKAVDGTANPTCRAYFQQAGDNISGQGPYAYYRWWSHKAVVPLQNGDFWVQGSFDPSEWSSVFGEFANASPAAQQGFQNALNNAAFVGLTFGGEFFGHGVYATQQGGFTMFSYSVQ